MYGVSRTVLAFRNRMLPLAQNGYMREEQGILRLLLYAGAPEPRRVSRIPVLMLLSGEKGYSHAE